MTVREPRRPTPSGDPAPTGAPVPSTAQPMSILDARPPGSLLDDSLIGRALCRRLHDHGRRAGWSSSTAAVDGGARGRRAGRGRRLRPGRAVARRATSTCCCCTRGRGPTSARWPSSSGTRSGTQGLKLGHSVRTREGGPRRSPPTTSTRPPRCCRSATSPATPRSPRSWPARPLALWRKRSKRWLDELGPAGARRATTQAGEVAFLLEPDLKEGRGGLRDVARPDLGRGRPGAMLRGDDDASLADAYETAARRCGSSCTGAPAGRATGCCSQEQDAVAEALGYARRRRADAVGGPAPPARSPGPATRSGPASRAR